MISVIDPGYDRAPYNEKVDGLVIQDPVATLQREVPALAEKCDVVVLLANMENSSRSVDILRALEGQVYTSATGLLAHDLRQVFLIDVHHAVGPDLPGLLPPRHIGGRAGHDHLDITEAIGQAASEHGHDPPEEVLNGQGHGDI